VRRFAPAGIRPDGSWVRLYPIPFRRLDEEEQYSKFDLDRIGLVRSRSDPRPETCHPADARAIRVIGHVGTEDKWRERRELVFTRQPPMIGSSHCWKARRRMRFRWPYSSRQGFWIFPGKSASEIGIRQKWPPCATPSRKSEFFRFHGRSRWIFSSSSASGPLRFSLQQ
jgi:hypothetical protein